MFKKGDRVALNAEWMKHSGGMVGAYTINRRATVVGVSSIKYPSCIRIIFDGTKTPQRFHQSFFNLVKPKVF
jgi:hypothetical protein